MYKILNHLIGGGRSDPVAAGTVARLGDLSPYLQILAIKFLSWRLATKMAAFNLLFTSTKSFRFRITYYGKNAFKHASLLFDIDIFSYTYL